MALVKRVQQVQVTMTASNTTATVALDTEFDTSNCIPVITRRVTTDATDPDALEEYYVKPTFLTSPNRLQVETQAANERVMVIEATIVEFESTEANVYHGEATITDQSLAIDLSTDHSSVVVANTFAIASGYPTTTGSEESYASIQVELVDADTLDLGRRSSTGSHESSYWVVEAIGGTPAFTVQHVNATISTSTSSVTKTAPTDFEAVLPASTWAIGSHNTFGAGTKNENNPYLALTDGSTLHAERVSTSSSNGSDITWMLVEFAGNETVQHGIFDTGATGSGTELVTLNPEVSLNAMPYIAGMGMRHGKFPGSTAANVPDGMVAATITDTDELTLTRYNANGLGNYEIAWQVVEWDDGSAPAPARKVMVVS